MRDDICGCGRATTVYIHLDTTGGGVDRFATCDTCAEKWQHDADHRLHGVQEFGIMERRKGDATWP